MVWTGTEALVVGGVDSAGQPDPAAAAYDPATDNWRTLAEPPSGSRRINPLVVWTGTDMLLIGGDNPDGSLLVSYGEAYDPTTDTWRVIASPPVGFVTDRSPAAWTGRELLVWPWDGGGSTMVITPIAYDPSHRHVAGARRATGRAAPAGRVGVDWYGVDRLGWHHRRRGVRRRRRLRPDIRHVAGDSRLAAVAPAGSRRVDRCGADHRRRVDRWCTGDRERRVGIVRRCRLRPGIRRVAGDHVRDPPIPGFVPLWTGSRMIMVAKGNAFVYDVASDRWIEPCCVGESGAGAVGTPVWTGSAVLLIGSSDPGRRRAAHPTVMLLHA